MKILCIIGFFFIMIPRLAAQWEPVSVADINGKWLAGDKQVVVLYAEKRLSRDLEDFLALLIMWDYAITTLSIEDLRRLAPSLRKAASVSTGTEFLKHKALLLADIDSVVKIANTLSPDMLMAEASKGELRGKPMNTLLHLKALERDGYLGAARQHHVIQPNAPSPMPLTHPYINTDQEVALKRTDSAQDFVNPSVVSLVPKRGAEPAAAPKSGPVWWIVGLIILATGVVFVARRKNPKS